MERGTGQARPSAAERRRTVAIVQPRLPHYRVPFFVRLRSHLDEYGVSLRLLYGLPHAHHEEAYRRAGLLAELPWAEPFRERYLPFGFVWQPVLVEVMKTDLVVVEGASRPALNYALHLARTFGGPRLVTWGHGWNHQATRPRRASERLKLWLGRHCDAYFAYTEPVRDRLIELGYDSRRVTNVQNTVATPELKPTAAEVQQLENELGLTGGERVVLFCGRMYPEKQLGLLIEAARRAHARLPSLVLLLAGAGPDEALAREAARQDEFVHYLGPISGRRKAGVFRLARFLVVPGLVGLAIVDAFHAGLPLVTVRYPHHSPEIAYLCPGENGLLVAQEAEALADALVQLASDDVLLSRLRAGALATAEGLGMDEMVRRFTEGLLRVLEQSNQP